MPNKPMLSTRIPLELADRVRLHKARTRMTIEEIVAEALDRYLRADAKPGFPRIQAIEDELARLRLRIGALEAEQGVTTMPSAIPTPHESLGGPAFGA